MIITGITIISVNSRTERKSELENAVSSAVHQTVNYAGSTDFKGYKSDEEMMASFTKNLMLNINSDGEIKIEIFGVDCQKGLLSVNVTQTFSYLIGKKDSISVRKTAIYEK